MKKIVLASAFLALFAGNALAQGNGNGNGNDNRTSNEIGQNGNGNGYGHSNGNNGNGNGGGNNGNGNGNGGGGQVSEGGDGEAGGATQYTHLALSNAIEIKFTDNLSHVGGNVTLSFTNVNNYANGVESSEQELSISSNKNYTIAVKTNADKFTYSGTTSPAPDMPVNGVLALVVTENNTNGSIAGPFSNSSYATLTNSNQGLLTAATRGGNKTFSVKYKATPGFAYPAGNYSVNVVYTATQQ